MVADLTGGVAAVGFRARTGWLHTWAGVLLGGVLFAIFWTGTLSVFDAEIDRWMKPETRLRLPASEAFSWDRWWKACPPDPGSPTWLVYAPTERVPGVDVWGCGGGRQAFDPQSGGRLDDRSSLAGTGFIYPFHVSLHVRPAIAGYWIIGAAGMAMLVLCVSGVIIHRRLLSDFFLLRLSANTGRLTLDLHNLTGVLALPFHIVITLSGLVIFTSLYYPGVADRIYRGDRQAIDREVSGGYRREPAGRPGTLASLDAMAAEAARRWDGAPPRAIRVLYPGDAHAYVMVEKSSAGSVTRSLEAVFFDGRTGVVVAERTMRPAARVQQFLAGLHLMRFRHWTLRWIAFALGLFGCVLIATGFLFWIETRRRRHLRDALPGVRIVEALTIGCVTGIIIATLAFFVANRLFPPAWQILGAERAVLEIRVFYLAWLAAFVHASIRPRRAWGEQCWSIAVLAVAAVVLNAVTTGDHLLRSVLHAHLWPVAGMDMLLLAGAFFSAAAARRLTISPWGRAPSARRHSAISR